MVCVMYAHSSPTACCSYSFLFFLLSHSVILWFQMKITCPEMQTYILRQRYLYSLRTCSCPFPSFEHHPDKRVAHCRIIELHSLRPICLCFISFRMAIRLIYVPIICVCWEAVIVWLSDGGHGVLQFICYDEQMPYTSAVENVEFWQVVCSS